MWKIANDKANKNGLRSTFYSVNKDEYTGEWKNNKRHGNIFNSRGTYKWNSKGLMYEGDWINGKRHGFGVLSVIGEDMKHRKIYAGSWKNDMRDGFGENCYSDKEFYEGEWTKDLRSGWGRMYCKDGSIYEGRWREDKRCGDGMLRLPNENRFEGSWLNDMKNGRGKFFFLNSGQMMEGVWVNDIPKCCQMTDIGREQASRPTEFPIPEVTFIEFC
ncbi:unnamed protein product [Protopolystoma xenopodis]|uniref:MORN repeat-containing protein 3 n=1 Tax=Protopolystoma xenopodis TaxID=117903 RepID=A0A3S5AJ93_9PLAT|nr:unnamed protein product [Protopolystoma xenopodis]